MYKMGLYITFPQESISNLTKYESQHLYTLKVKEVKKC